MKCARGSRCSEHSSFRLELPWPVSLRCSSLMSQCYGTNAVFNWAFNWLSNYLSDSSSNCYFSCLHWQVMLNGAVAKFGVSSEWHLTPQPNATHRDYCSSSLTVCCKCWLMSLYCCSSRPLSVPACSPSGAAVFSAVLHPTALLWRIRPPRSLTS